MESTKLIPLAAELYPNGHIFILAAPSKEAFIASFQQHFNKLATQLASDATTSSQDAFTRFRQAAFIGSVYSELRQ